MRSTYHDGLVLPISTCEELWIPWVRAMETLRGTFDLGFSLVRRKIRLGFLLSRSWGVEIRKGSKYWEKKPSNGPFTHGGTGTSKGGTGTKSVLPGFPWLVPVPISVVPVPLNLLFFFLGCSTNL